jgi:uncharacterized protein
LFTWDETKDASNKKKHGIGFDTARLVFEDPLHLSRLERIVDGEERWQTVGLVSGIALLIVAHTWRGDADEEHIRIISTRVATSAERKAYEDPDT